MTAQIGYPYKQHVLKPLHEDSIGQQIQNRVSVRRKRVCCLFFDKLYIGRETVVLANMQRSYSVMPLLTGSGANTAHWVTAG